MADNFGTFQPTAHEVVNRSLDCVVFGRQVPVRSDTWTLVGQVAQESSRNTSTGPSGWLHTGAVLQVPDGAADAGYRCDGAVLASTSFAANTFKLCTDGGLRARVNGWELSIRGTNGADSDNTLILEDMTGVGTGRTDLVLLEVWRELVPADSLLFKDGNVLSTTSPMTTGVAQVVQVRYRIRTITGPVDISNGQDGFSNSTLARAASSTESSFAFSNMASNGDPGLWRAGDGSAMAISQLGTVDGYCYAIPMFGVYRRGHRPAGYSLAFPDSTACSFKDDVVSDRPDRKFYDVVYADDIVDLRRTPCSANELPAIAERTFSRLVQGRHAGTRGEAHLASSTSLEVPGGSVLSKVDVVGSAVSGQPHAGDMTLSVGKHKVRTACSAAITHNNNLVSFYPGTAWLAGATYEVLLVGSAEYGRCQVGAPYGAYLSDGSSILGVEDYACELSPHRNSWSLTIPEGSSLAGTTSEVTFQYPAYYQAGPYGLLDVPESYLEIRSADGAIIPVEGAPRDIPGKPLSSRDMVVCEGGESASTWDTGILIHRHEELSPGADSVAIQLNGGKLYGHSVAGVLGVKRRNADGSYSDWQNFEVSKETSSTSVVYTITDIGTIGSTSDSVMVVFQAASRFFRVSRNARGITDSYETIEAPVVYKGGSYYIYTAGRPILGVSHSIKSDGVPYPFATVEGRSVPLKSISKVTGASGKVHLQHLLPVGPSGYQSKDYLPDRILVEFDNTSSVRPTMAITVPVTVLSGVALGESYSVHYSTRGYQGLLRSVPAQGFLLARTSSVVSSSGSGAEADRVYETKAMFGSKSDKRLVAGLSTKWRGRVLPGDLIFRMDSPDDRYEVASVLSDTQLQLLSPYQGEGDEGEVEVSVLRRDTPAAGFLCLADRMPGATETAGAVAPAAISSVGLSLFDPPANVQVDPCACSRDGFVVLGGSGRAVKGRSGVATLEASGEDALRITYGPLQAPACAYQSWAFLEKGTGRAYLAVASSGLSGDNSLVCLAGGIEGEAVDLFELVGRPVVSRG